jgi:hypothetical protein
MLHVYALVRKPANVPATAGIEDAPLRVVSVADEIEAVVSETNGAGAPGEAAILAHARVVEALAEANDAVLPARFAHGIADDGDLRQRLQGRRREVVDAFARVSGCVEIAVRAFRASPAAEPAGSGRAYMQRRLEEVGSADRLARELESTLTPLARESASRVLASGESLVAAAYLVPRADVDEFRAAIESFERSRPGLTLVTTGPWPPYSFALLEAEAA